MSRPERNFRWSRISILLFYAATAMAGIQATVATVAQQNVINEVEAAERSFTTALVEVDIPRLESLLTDDFTWVHASGEVEVKPEYLTGVRETRGHQALRRERTAIRIYEKAAVTSGLVHITVFTEERGERILDLRYTAVYVMRNGAWRLATWQNTRLPE